MDALLGLSLEDLAKPTADMQNKFKADLDKMEQDAVDLSDEAYNQLLSELGTAHIDYRMTSKTSIRIRPAIPKDVRREMYGIKEAYDTGEDKFAFEERMYDFLSRMCLDHPYCTREAWRKIDDETGSIPIFFTDITRAILKNEEGVECFRHDIEG